MDSIITSQKVARRRSFRELQNRSAAGVFPYVQLDSRRIEVPRIGHSVKQGRGRKRFSKLGSQLALLGARLRGELGFGLRRSFDSLTTRPSRTSKKKRTIRVVALLVALVAPGGILLLARGPAFPLPSGPLLPTDASAQDLLLDYVSPDMVNGKADDDQDLSSLPPAPVTLQMSIYTVRPGDTLGSIAKRFGRNVGSIISANGIRNTTGVKTGTQLRIPNLDGIIYVVHSGDNLAGIAKRFKIETIKIVDANDLGSASLNVGQSLFIPGARLPEQTVMQALGPRVAWPARGPISSPFGYRPDPFTGVRRFHAGIDIAVDADTPIKAAMDGTVADVGYNGDFGNYVILNHANGFQTLYGHMTKASVPEGMKVAQGDVIGLSGNTGYSTGPHLHFGLYRRSVAVNPLKYLK
jgi:murein DD-endopeptidase MepM/ murein hydrolase activator NlpD